jgi:hypothetical protein
MRKKTTLAAAFLSTAALMMAPAAGAVSSHSHRGQHGNHCGLGHVKHTHGLGRTCPKNHRHG